jgi:hypothetical protein
MAKDGSSLVAFANSMAKLKYNDEDSSDDSPAIELIVSDFGEPAGEPEEHRHRKKNAEDSTSYVR